MRDNKLKKQLEDERNNLMIFKKVLEEMRDNETNLKSDLIKKDVRIEEIMNKLEETRLGLKAQLLKNEQLECSLSLLSEQLEMALSAAAVEGDSCHSQSSCQLLDTSQDDAVVEGTEQQLLSSTSTEMISPAIITVDHEGLGSIMEEIEEVVVLDDLPSPICKKEVRKSEVKMSEMKHKLVEIVKDKFVLEDYLWLSSFEREIEVGISAVLEAAEEEDCSRNVKEDAEAEEMTAGVLSLRLSWSLFLLAFLLLIFTFLGGLEIDYQMYYPITWHMLRLVVGDCLPGPAILVKYSSWSVSTVL